MYPNDTLVKLTHGMLLRTLAGDHRRTYVGTARGYAAQYKNDPEAAHKKALADGDATAWTNQECAVLHDGSPEVKAEEKAKFLADMAQATTIFNGQLVEIEGEIFKTVILGWQYSDPIAFKRLI